VQKYRAILAKLQRYRISGRARVIALDGPAARATIWIAVAVFLVSFGLWAARSGIRIRREAWIYSRSLRYHGDISNAVNFGSEVLQLARQDMDPAASIDPARSTPGLLQIVRAEGREYDNYLQRYQSGDDPRLDYPPLRLLTMTLWMRHVQQKFPNLSNWPGPWRMGAQPNEDIAAPLLDLNTLFAGLSSLFVFLLVWLWVDRGGRPGTSRRTSLLGPRRPPMRAPTPLIDSAGLLIFVPLACIFYYALLVAVAPAPEPPPMVDFSGVPTVSRTSEGISATLRATINSQGAPTQWSVDWGTAPGDYSHTVRGDDVSDSGLPQDVAITLSNLPADSQVHYRISARNDAPDRDPGRGITRTDDGILLTGQNVTQQPPPPAETYGAVWLTLWQWVGVGALFAAVGASIRMMPAEHRGWATGLLAGMLMWLNPAILVDTHVWPQWDVWLIPPFLLAALLASVEWWFAAGVVFGVGAMFKGQFLIGAPVLLLWPLLSMRWGALTRMVLGIVVSSAVLLSPWIVLGNAPFSWKIPAVQWIARVGVAAVLASVLPLLRGPFWRIIGSLWGHKEDISLVRLGLVAGSVAIVFIGMISLVLARWPADGQLQRGVGMWLLLAILVTPWLIRRRWLGVFVSGMVGVAIWMSAWLYHGDWAWETIGFEYGTGKFDHIAMARGSNGNLASILADHFGWELHDQFITLRLANLSGALPQKLAASLGMDGNPVYLEVRQALIAIFAACLVACAAGAAINDRRNHPRFLAALAAPWMLMPNILGQMMCRYQIWGAAMSVLLIGISTGFGLVTALASLLAAGMVGNQLLDRGPERSPQLHQIMTTLSPDDGWIMLCMAALALYMAAVPGKRAEESAHLSNVDLPSPQPITTDEIVLPPPEESLAGSEVGV
jgi:hypothetical protein